jgi:hypothetical protein
LLCFEKWDFPGRIVVVDSHDRVIGRAQFISRPLSHEHQWARQKTKDQLWYCEICGIEADTWRLNELGGRTGGTIIIEKFTPELIPTFDTKLITNSRVGYGSR